MPVEAATPTWLSKATCTKTRIALAQSTQLSLATAMVASHGNGPPDLLLGQGLIRLIPRYLRDRRSLLVGLLGNQARNRRRSRSACLQLFPSRLPLGPLLRAQGRQGRAPSGELVVLVGSERRTLGPTLEEVNHDGRHRLVNEGRFPDEELSH